MIKKSDSIEGLLPVHPYVEYDATDNPLRKPVRKNIIQAFNGERICPDIKPEWSRYIATALNNYVKYEDNDVRAPKTKYGRVIAIVEIPGEPVPRTDGRTVMLDENGNAVIGASATYGKRISNVMKHKKEIQASIAEKLPLQGPLHIQATFYFTDIHRRYALSDLYTSGLDLLRRLGIILREGNDIVSSMDGTSATLTYGKPRTVIVLRHAMKGDSK